MSFEAIAIMQRKKDKLVCLRVHCVELLHDSVTNTCTMLKGKQYFAGVARERERGLGGGGGVDEGERKNERERPRDKKKKGREKARKTERRVSE